LETRWVDQDLVEGLCHQCHQWVAVSNVKRKNSVLWYRHAHKVRSLLLQEKEHPIHTLHCSAIYIISRSPTFQKSDRSNISTLKKQKQKKTPNPSYISLFSSKVTLTRLYEKKKSVKELTTFFFSPKK
jgi:hypothetical protein